MDKAERKCHDAEVDLRTLIVDSFDAEQWEPVDEAMCELVHVCHEWGHRAGYLEGIEAAAKVAETECTCDKLKDGYGATIGRKCLCARVIANAIRALPTPPTDDPEREGEGDGNA